jgi:gluconolactonase
MLSVVDTLAYGFGLIEGPRADGEGNLWFSDVPNGGVFRRAVDGTVTTVVPRRKTVGGIAFHADGGIVISGRDICHVRDGVSRILFERPERVGGFNDLFCDAAGRVYTGSLRSDPFTSGERVAGEAYVVDAPGSARLLYGEVGLSNGIGISPAGDRLYHADTAAREIIVHALSPAGEVSERGVLVRMPPGERPDGLAVDEEGGIWIALVGAGVVRRVTPDGAFDTVIDIPATMVTSVCFGGPDRADMFVVTADNTDEPSRVGTVFRLRPGVRGAIVHPARI